MPSEPEKEYIVKDNDLRGTVLQNFYDLRHKKSSLQLPDVAIPDADWRVTSNICMQLSDHGLIEWSPSNSIDETIFGGLGRITAHGVDVIEGHSRPRIAITVHDRSVAVHGSTNVQIGNSNTLSATIDINNVFKAIDESTASDEQKEEAKSLFTKLTGNATFAAIIGAITSIAAAAPR